MESESTETPLKVCPHCAVASRTSSETCPACGRPYRRRLWRWWFAIPIVALAFGGGYFGRKALQDDETESAGLTSREARSMVTGASPSELEQVLDGQKPADVRRQEAGDNELLCRYYTVVDRDDEFWEFCFLSGQLEVARPIEVERPPG